MVLEFWPVSRASRPIFTKSRQLQMCWDPWVFGKRCILEIEPGQRAYLIWKAGKNEDLGRSSKLMSLCFTAIPQVCCTKTIQRLKNSWIDTALWRFLEGWCSVWPLRRKEPPRWKSSEPGSWHHQHRRGTSYCHLITPLYILLGLTS